MTILNVMKGQIMELNYYCYVEEDEYTTKDKLPQLNSWSIKNFTGYILVLNLNFSNPMYVSTSTE